MIIIHYLFVFDDFVLVFEIFPDCSIFLRNLPLFFIYELLKMPLKCSSISALYTCGFNSAGKNGVLYTPGIVAVDTK